MENKKICLYDKHVALGARMQPFVGSEMPILCSSIIEEHQAICQRCSVSDISHMGKAYVTSTGAKRYVNHISTSDVADASINQIFYGMILHPDGGMVDDLLVYKMGENEFFLIFNTTNIDRDMAWVRENAEGFDVTIDHRSDYYR